MVLARPFIKLEKHLMPDEFDETSASLRRISRKFCISEVVVRDILKKARVKLPKKGY